ncbi:MAG: HEPN domain-containing protein [Bacteroidales bacterium]|nr:HEPN domain-containing protein [Bacteroidales bacterium]
MSLSDEERSIIVSLEIEKAFRHYKQALIMQREEQWDGMANRLYYAVFHAVSALLIFDKHEVNSHKGSHVIFSQYYIKTGKMPKNFGELYRKLERMREESDYNCTYDEEPEVLQSNIGPAKEMIDSIAAMVKE